MKGGEIELEVARNVDYNVAIERDWITQVQTKGLVTDKLLFVVAENTSSEIRTSSVTFTSKDGKLSQKITIEQGANTSSGEEKLTPPNNEIWYTSTDGKTVGPYTGYNGSYSFGSTSNQIMSNTIENGKGRIVFKADISWIGSYVFQNKTTLKTITLPESITSINTYAFTEIESLESITIPIYSGL